MYNRVAFLAIHFLHSKNNTFCNLREAYSEDLLIFIGECFYRVKYQEAFKDCIHLYVAPHIQNISFLKVKFFNVIDLVPQ